MVKKKIWLLAGAAILVVGSISAWWFYFPIYTIQSAVKKPLLDPESAQFSDVKFYRSTGYGCGFVNARNKMGGYVGRKQFVASLDGQVVLAPTEDEPAAPLESPEQLPTFTNLSIEGLMASQSRRLQESYDMLQKERKWDAEIARIRAESKTFKALVVAKCS